jgi:hypothetical protein
LESASALSGPQTGAAGSWSFLPTYLRFDVERGERVATEISATGGEVVLAEAHMQRETEASAFAIQYDTTKAPVGWRTCGMVPDHAADGIR